MLDTVTHNDPAFDLSVAGIGWLQLDAVGNVKLANEVAAQILGYSDVPELLGARRIFNEFVAAVFAVSHSIPVGNRWRAFLVQDAGGKWVSVHACLESIQGDSINVRLFGGTPVEWPLAPPQVLGGCDLSLLELSQSGLYIMSPDCQVLYVNRAHADMLGYEPEEMIGMSGSEVIDARDISQVRNVHGMPWRTGEMREMQVRMRMKHDMGRRHVIIRQGRIMHEGREAYVGSVRDVTDLRRGEQALKDYAKRLRRLSQQVLEVQENERRDLARELHDEVGQQLTLLKLLLTRLAGETEAASPVIREATAAVSTLMQQVRDLSLDLRPSMLDDLGLGATLRWYAARVARLAALETCVEIDPGFPRLVPDAETLFFRVAQEGITNVMRHAHAENLGVRLTRDGDLIELRVSDDGRGFDAESARRASIRGKSAGLLGMQERAALGGAELTIESTPGTGTVLRLLISGKRAGIRSNFA